MKNKIIAVILTLTLICSSAFMLASADNLKLGDINNDGQINAMDARLALRAAASLEKLTDEQKLVADVNFDKKINAADARKILRASAKIETLPEMPTEEPSSEDIETTTEPTTAEPEPDTGIIAEEYPEAIDTFFSGKYYLNCAIDDTYLKLATNGKNYEFTASLDGLEISMMTLNKILHIKYTDINGKKKYLPFDDETKNLLKNLTGQDFEDIFGSDMLDSFEFLSIEVSGKPVLTKGEYENTECDIYTFSLDDAKIAFYCIGEDIKRIVIVDKDGNDSSVINVVEFSSEIPSDMLSTRGFTKVNIIGFMTDLMGMIPE